MKKKDIIILIVLVLVITALVLWSAGVFNKLLKKEGGNEIAKEGGKAITKPEKLEKTDASALSEAEIKKPRTLGAMRRVN